MNVRAYVLGIGKKRTGKYTDISTHIQRFLVFSTSKVYMLVECLQKGNISTEHSVRIAVTATLIC